MTKDGFAFLVSGFTGDEAARLMTKAHRTDAGHGPG